MTQQKDPPTPTTPPPTLLEFLDRLGPTNRIDKIALDADDRVATYEIMSITMPVQSGRGLEGFVPDHDRASHEPRSVMSLRRTLTSHGENAVRATLGLPPKPVPLAAPSSTPKPFEGGWFGPSLRDRFIEAMDGAPPGTAIHPLRAGRDTAAGELVELSDDDVTTARLIEDLQRGPDAGPIPGRYRPHLARIIGDAIGENERLAKQFDAFRAAIPHPKGADLATIGPEDVRRTFAWADEQLSRARLQAGTEKERADTLADQLEQMKAEHARHDLDVSRSARATLQAVLDEQGIALPTSPTLDENSAIPLPLPTLIGVLRAHLAAINLKLAAAADAQAEPVDVETTFGPQRVGPLGSCERCHVAMKALVSNDGKTWMGRGCPRCARAYWTTDRPSAEIPADVGIATQKSLEARADEVTGGAVMDGTSRNEALFTKLRIERHRDQLPTVLIGPPGVPPTIRFEELPTFGRFAVSVRGTMVRADELLPALVEYTNAWVQEERFAAEKRAREAIRAYEDFINAAASADVVSLRSMIPQIEKLPGVNAYRDAALRGVVHRLEAFGDVARLSAFLSTGPAFREDCKAGDNPVDVAIALLKQLAIKRADFQRLGDWFPLAFPGQVSLGDLVEDVAEHVGRMRGEIETARRVLDAQPATITGSGDRQIAHKAETVVDAAHRVTDDLADVRRFRDGQKKTIEGLVSEAAARQQVIDDVRFALAAGENPVATAARDLMNAYVARGDEIFAARKVLEAADAEDLNKAAGRMMATIREITKARSRAVAERDELREDLKRTGVPATIEGHHFVVSRVRQMNDAGADRISLDVCGVSPSLLDLINSPDVRELAARTIAVTIGGARYSNVTLGAVVFDGEGESRRLGRIDLLVGAMTEAAPKFIAAAPGVLVSAQTHGGPRSPAEDAARFAERAERGRNQAEIDRWKRLARTRGDLLVALTFDTFSADTFNDMLRAATHAEDFFQRHEAYDKATEADPYDAIRNVRAARARLDAASEAGNATEREIEADRNARIAALKPQSIWRESRRGVFCRVGRVDPNGGSVSPGRANPSLDRTIVGWTGLGFPETGATSARHFVGNWAPMLGKVGTNHTISGFDPLSLVKLAIGGTVKVHVETRMEKDPGPAHTSAEHAILWPAWAQRAARTVGFVAGAVDWLIDQSTLEGSTK